MIVFEYWTIYSIIFFFEKDLFYHLIEGLNIEYKKAIFKKKIKVLTCKIMRIQKVMWQNIWGQLKVKCQSSNDDAWWCWYGIIINDQNLFNNSH